MSVRGAHSLNGAEELRLPLHRNGSSTESSFAPHLVFDMVAHSLNGAEELRLPLHRNGSLTESSFAPHLVFDMVELSRGARLAPHLERAWHPLASRSWENPEMQTHGVVRDTRKRDRRAGRGGVGLGVGGRKYCF